MLAQSFGSVADAYHRSRPDYDWREAFAGAPFAPLHEAAFPRGRDRPGPARRPLSDDELDRLAPLPNDEGLELAEALRATDAPLLPHQCERLALRASFGIARTSGAGENSSGDLLLAWSIANALRGDAPTRIVTMLANDRIDELFYAAIDATAESIVNALLAAETMTGRGGATAHGLDADRLREILAR